MSIEKLVPVNPLEESLACAQAGRMQMKEFLAILRVSDLFMVSQSEGGAASGVQPILFDRNGVPMAAVFTDSSRASRYGDLVKVIIRMNGEELLKQVPPGYGIVLNPGFDTGLEILPEGLKAALGT